jgi:hypothetical protein
VKAEEKQALPFWEKKHSVENHCARASCDEAPTRRLISTTTKTPRCADAKRPGNLSYIFLALDQQILLLKSIQTIHYTR